MLKINYKDTVLPPTGRVYRKTENANGTLQLADVTVYEAEGDSFGAADINATNAAVNNGAVWRYTHTKHGTVHALEGAGENIKFLAAARYTYADTFTVNGTPTAAVAADGKPLADGFFAAGCMVQCFYNGDTLNFSHGGAALNYKVIAVAAESELPQSTVENTLAVSTEMPFTVSGFAMALPKTAQEGEVVFVCGADSPCHFTAVKHKSIPLCVRLCYQYVQGAWQKKDFWIYQQGWQTVFTYLLSGTADNTGAWKSSDPGVAAIKSSTAQGITLEIKNNLTYNANTMACILAGVDFSKYSTLRVEAKWSNMLDIPMLTVNKSIVINQMLATARLGTVNEWTQVLLDIKNIAVEGYIGFYCVPAQLSSGTVQIRQILLEP